MDDVSLKPCPFCGANDVYLYQHGDNYGYVECGTCNARFTTTTATCTIDVIDAWNERADSRVLNSELLMNGQLMLIDVAKLKRYLTWGHE